MRPSRRPITLATRSSRLALAQSQAVANVLQRLNPNIRVALLPLESEGDRPRSHPLAGSGRKGRHTRPLERALFDGRADVAVHALKDLPVAPTPGLILAAITRRTDVREAWLARDGAAPADLPAGATVASGSGRRIAQLRRLRADLTFQPIRGNLDSRLKQFESGDFDATVVARAGLIRAGLTEVPHVALSVDQMLPAAGQGALALQCRVEDHVSLRRCLPLNDAMTATAVHAERELVGRLEADCHSCLAVLVEPLDDGRMRLRAQVLSADGAQCLSVDLTGSMGSVRRLVKQAERQLCGAGAMTILHGQ